MKRRLKVLMILCVLTTALPLTQASVELHGFQFPEKRAVDLSFVPTPAAPSARITADVTFKKGQARIDLMFEYMKPAILYGGDVTCYVLWAVTRDGNAENLGELVTRKSSGRLQFSTGQKNFALMVTGEAYYLVGKPSNLVVFTNAPGRQAPDESTAFQFDNFGPDFDAGMSTIIHIKWDAKIALELLQARKAYELATRRDAAVHATTIHAEAGAALESANELALSAPRSRELVDVARRAVALSNEAINVSVHRIEAIEVERQLAKRREETAALERRAAEAEIAAQEAQRLSAQVREEAERMRVEKERTVAETAALRIEKSSLETTMTQMRQEELRLRSGAEQLHREKAALQMESDRLRTEKSALEQEAARLVQEKTRLEQASQQLLREKEEVSSRLQSALSHVADTQSSARGFVVNLPDILFDVDEATLKTEARLMLAKLAGILLVMPEQSVLVEGHTDSTGSPEYNLDLSRRRATSVVSLLNTQGLDANRLASAGYGIERPVADNSTREGRSKNRRVEIVISDEDASGATN